MQSVAQENRLALLTMLVGSVMLAVATENRGAKASDGAVPVGSPSECCYAPAGKYVKDHTLVYHGRWWHLISQSGTEGYFWGNSGDEETVLWSISRDLVNWERRGHVLHVSQRKGQFDEHEIWAIFCLSVNGGFYVFYGGCRVQIRPADYCRLWTSMEVLSRVKQGRVGSMTRALVLAAREQGERRCVQQAS